jgi:purine-binding chemotaxis protein CheW
MGRLAEARKRARNRKEKKPAASPPSPPAVEEPAFAPALPKATPPPSRSARIALPSSALAAEILDRPEAAAVRPAEPVVSSVPAEVKASEGPARAPNLSFFSAPQREEQKAVEATEHVATFFLSKEEYGVDVRLVQEIIRVTEITQVPRAPEFIKGVINLRGRIIPVVDLKRKLGLGEVETSRQARIVVVEVRGRLIGLLVDGASQVLKLPVSSIEPAPEEVVSVDEHHIRGVAKLEARLIILVDLQRVLAHELQEGSGQVRP